MTWCYCPAAGGRRHAPVSDCPESAQWPSDDGEPEGGWTAAHYESARHSDERMERKRESMITKEMGVEITNEMVDAICEAATPGYQARWASRIGLHAVIAQRKRVRRTLRAAFSADGRTMGKSDDEPVREAAQALIEAWWNYEIKTYTAKGQACLNALRVALSQSMSEPCEGASGRVESARRLAATAPSTEAWVAAQRLLREAERRSDTRTTRKANDMITNEMAECAAEAAWQAWPKPSWVALKDAMFPALQAVLENDPVRVAAQEACRVWFAEYMGRAEQSEAMIAPMNAVQAALDAVDEGTNDE